MKKNNKLLEEKRKKYYDEIAKNEMQFLTSQNLKQNELETKKNIVEESEEKNRTEKEKTAPKDIDKKELIDMYRKEMKEYEKQYGSDCENIYKEEMLNMWNELYGQER